jgi:integrase
MSLTWDQVDFDRGVITLHETKNGERRALHLQGHALELMQARKSARYLVTPLVFPSRKRPLSPVDLRPPWEVALKQADVRDFRWHDLRHTCASYLAMSDASLAEIAEVLGHRTLNMVMRYTHLSQAHTTTVVARMNKKYLGSS